MDTALRSLLHVERTGGRAGERAGVDEYLVRAVCRGWRGSRSEVAHILVQQSGRGNANVMLALKPICCCSRVNWCIRSAMSVAAVLELPHLQVTADVYGEPDFLYRLFGSVSRWCATLTGSESQADIIKSICGTVVTRLPTPGPREILVTPSIVSPHHDPAQREKK